MTILSTLAALEDLAAVARRRPDDTDGQDFARWSADYTRGCARLVALWSCQDAPTPENLAADGWTIDDADNAGICGWETGDVFAVMAFRGGETFVAYDVDHGQVYVARRIDDEWATVPFGRASTVGELRAFADAIERLH